MNADFMTSSVIRCELSILPRSANNESAADDLYALKNYVKFELKEEQDSNALNIVTNTTQKVRLIKRILYTCLCGYISVVSF